MKKYLIDSSSYFRLAKSIHPLLYRKFGSDPSIIYILKECDKEFSKNTALQNKFNWVTQDEFKNNRKESIIKLTNHDINSIDNSINFIKLYSHENYLSLSDIDAQFIATSLELDLILITDDSDMIEVAKEFNVKVVKSIELLKILYDYGEITSDSIKEIRDYWIYTKDLPKDFNKDFDMLFGNL